MGGSGETWAGSSRRGGGNVPDVGWSADPDFTFTETNTGDQPVTVSVSPTDFTVSESGSPVWESNPENDGQPPTSVTLQPGQSLTQTATWDGTIMGPGKPGTSTSEAVNQFGTFQVTNPNAPQGDTATFQITDPLQGALTTDQATYLVGQPVQLTYTETNTSSQTLTISTANPLYQILHDGQPEMPVMDPTIPTAFQAVIEKPGPGVVPRRDVARPSRPWEKARGHDARATP